MKNYLKIKIYAYMDKDASENMKIIMHKNDQKNLKKKLKKNQDARRRMWISHTRV